MHEHRWKYNSRGACPKCLYKDWEAEHKHCSLLNIKLSWTDKTLKRINHCVHWIHHILLNQFCFCSFPLSPTTSIKKHTNFVHVYRHSFVFFVQVTANTFSPFTRRRETSVPFLFKMQWLVFLCKTAPPQRKPLKQEVVKNPRFLFKTLIYTFSHFMKWSIITLYQTRPKYRGLKKDVWPDDTSSSWAWRVLQHSDGDRTLSERLLTLQRLFTHSLHRSR